MAEGDHHGGFGDRVLYWAGAYDVLVFVLTLGRERRFRERLVDLAEVAKGEAVLDVGCGTGSLAMAARRRAGDEGSVCGVDLSPKMVARARRKAAKAGLDVRFDDAPVEALPFPDATFDAVLATLMLHHLSDEGLERGLEEVARVLKPGGRFVAVDIGRQGKNSRSWGHFRRAHRHSEFDLDRIGPRLETTGLHVEERGPADTREVIGIPELRFVRARRNGSGPAQHGTDLGAQEITQGQDQPHDQDPAQHDQ